MMHDLVPSDFLREAIPTPTLAEQKEIGAFLVGLDHLITLHQREPPHTMKEGKNVDQHQ